MHKRFGFTVVVALLSASVAAAEGEPTVEQSGKKISGHLGVVVPIATAQVAGRTTSLIDGVVVGVSSGLGIPIVGPLAFDVELVMLISAANRGVNILIHPGLLVGLPLGFTTGVRGAWETSGVFGFTPLINKGFKVGAVVFYVEGAFPVRFGKDTTGRETSSVTFALHTGMGF